jgi:hypothetical protein
MRPTDPTSEPRSASEPVGAPRPFAPGQACRQLARRIEGLLLALLALPEIDVEGEHVAFDPEHIIPVF